MGKQLFAKMNNVKDHTETYSTIKIFRELSLCCNFPNISKIVTF